MHVYYYCSILYESMHTFPQPDLAYNVMYVPESHTILYIVVVSRPLPCFQCCMQKMCCNEIWSGWIRLSPAEARIDNTWRAIHSQSETKQGGYKTRHRDCSYSLIRGEPGMLQALEPKQISWMLNLGIQQRYGIVQLVSSPTHLILPANTWHVCHTDTHPSGMADESG